MGSYARKIVCYFEPLPELPPAAEPEVLPPLLLPPIEEPPPIVLAVEVLPPEFPVEPVTGPGASIVDFDS